MPSWLDPPFHEGMVGGFTFPTSLYPNTTIFIKTVNNVKSFVGVAMEKNSWGDFLIEASSEATSDAPVTTLPCALIDPVVKDRTRWVGNTRLVSALSGLKPNVAYYFSFFQSIPCSFNCFSMACLINADMDIDRTET